MANEPTLEELVAAEKAAEEKKSQKAAEQADDASDDAAGDKPSDEAETEAETSTGGEAGQKKEGGEPDLIKILEEGTGYDFSVYKTPEEALRGLKNALQLIGQREEDAALAKALRARLGDERLAALLEEEGPTDQKGSTGPSSHLPETYEEYRALLAEAQMAGEDKQNPAYRRALAATDELAKSQFNLRKLVPELRKELEGLRKEFENHRAELQNQKQTQAVTEWMAEHASEIFQKDDPGKKTPFGEAVARAYRETYDHDLVRDEPANSTKRWELAYLQAKATLPPTKKTPLPSDRAMRQPGGPAKRPKPSSAADLFKQFDGRADQGEKVLEALVTQLSEEAD